MNLPANLVYLVDQPMHAVLCEHKGTYALYLVVPTQEGDTGCCPHCAHNTFTRMHEWLECEGCGFRVQNAHFKQTMGVEQD